MIFLIQNSEYNWQSRRVGWCCAAAEKSDVFLGGLSAFAGNYGLLFLLLVQVLFERFGGQGLGTFTPQSARQVNAMNSLIGDLSGLV